MNTLRTLLIILCSPVLLPAQSLSPEINQEITRRVNDHINPSIAIGILNPDGSKQFYNFGSYRTKMTKVPDSLTLYEIGSVTKTFTATLAGQYIEDPGTSTLNMYFPQTTLENRDLEGINTDQIINHSAGLPRLSAQFSPDQWSDPFKGYTEENLLEELRLLEPDTTRSWAYSNFGYGILGSTLEKISGKNFEVLMSRLFLEAGMNNTYPGHSPRTDSIMASPTNIGTLNKFWHFEGPSRYAGGLISSTHDLLQYLEYQVIHNDLFKEGPIENVIETGINNLGRDMLFYKDGWFIFKPDSETEILLHNGGTGGYTAFLGYNKKTGTGVVALSNSVSLVDDIALKLIYPLFRLKSPQRSVAYDLARAIDEGDTTDLQKKYLDLKAQEAHSNVIDIYWLERFYYGEGNFMISDQLSDILLLELPDDWEVLDIKGQNLEHLEKYDEARKMYEAALELNPDNHLLREKALQMTVKQNKRP